jgi:hypothetical protein
MTDAPNLIDQKQLDELYLAMQKPAEGSTQDAD